jgi:hypothetical protein
MIDKKTKGLKILKLKGMSFFLSANPYRHGDPAENEPGSDSIKTISIPLNFQDLSWMVTVEELVQDKGQKKPFGRFLKKRFNGFLVNILPSFANGCLED